MATERASMVTASSPECRTLFEMFSTPRGKVTLGRVELGADAGRIVMLRELTESASPEVPRAVEVTRSFVHPQLLKLVGVLADGARSHVASEYLPGISLFELTARARARQSAFEMGAAVRVIIDALRLAQRVEPLLREAGRPRVRLLYPDCVWIAHYGETLLSEAGVAAYLAMGRARQEVEEGAEAIERDVMTATVELIHLATAQLMTGDLAQAVKRLPPELAGVLRGYFLSEGAPPGERVADLLAGLMDLPQSLVGTEQDVAAALRRFAPELLAERQSKLTELGGRESNDIDSPTRVYGAAIPALLETEEVTIEVRKAFRGRPVTSRLPLEIQRPRPSAPEHGEGRSHGREPERERSPEREQSSEQEQSRSEPLPLRTASSSSTSGSRSKLRARFRFRPRKRRLLWMLVFFVFAALTLIAWRKPAWVRAIADRLGVQH
jgi:hypothetical protein